jgi:hypothetical protein
LYQKFIGQPARALQTKGLQLGKVRRAMGGRMVRRFLLVMCCVFVATTGVFAQERVGGGRIEGGFYPAGAMFFTNGANDAEPGFGDYTIGGWTGYNFNRHFGITGEFGVGIARRQDFDFANGLFQSVKSPYVAAYNGNGVWHPRGNDRSVAPYLTAGVGALTLYKTNGVKSLGLTTDPTFLSGNVGGGVKWYLDRHWGIQGDYRLLAVKGKDNGSPFFGLDQNRYGHRISWNIVLMR